MDEKKIQDKEQFAKPKNKDFLYLNRNYAMRISDNNQFLELISKNESKHVFFYLGFKIFSIYFSNFSKYLYKKVIFENQSSKKDDNTKSDWFNNILDTMTFDYKVIKNDYIFLINSDK